MTSPGPGRSLVRVARDDEFRKVAEDVGALALVGPGLPEAVEQARSSGRSTGEAFRSGIRGSPTRPDEA